MRVAHRLVMPAHDTKRHDRAIGLRHHSRNDRVKRAFARRNPVSMLGIENEAFAAIVEENAGFRTSQACAKVREDRIYETHRVAVAIDDGDVDRIAVFWRSLRRNRIDRAA